VVKYPDQKGFGLRKELGWVRGMLWCGYHAVTDEELVSSESRSTKLGSPRRRTTRLEEEDN
jgi:hypothetical protein